MLNNRSTSRASAKGVVRGLLGAGRQEVIVFLFVGGSAAVLFALFAGLLTSNGLRPWIASSLAYSAVVPFAYLGQKYLTFRSQVEHVVALPRYLATQLTALLLSGFISEIVFKFSDINAYVGFTFVSGTVASLNYLLLKFWTFKSP